MHLHRKSYGKQVILLAGTSNPDLTTAIAQELGVPVGSCMVGRFPDGEVHVRLDENVYRHDVFIVQSTSPPVNDHLIELLSIADACRRASAAHITAVMPYFGYARSDKRNDGQVPITARMVADLLQVVGISRVITVDIHATQIEGFFHIPVTNLTAVPALCETLRRHWKKPVVIVSPDAGRIRMATAYAQQLGTSTAVLHKNRLGAVEMEVKLLGGDVRGRTCLIVDDMVTSGVTAVKSIEALLNAGARPEFIIAATHGLFIEGAREKLTHAGLHEVYVTNTVSHRENDWPQLRRASVAPLITGEIKRAIAVIKG